jgi:hypothetical protein
MGNRKANKYIDDDGRKKVGAALRREMERHFANDSDKFRALEAAARQFSNEAPARSTIQRITTGEVGTSINQLFLLAKAMGIDPYRLFLDASQTKTVIDANELVSSAASNDPIPAQQGFSRPKIINSKKARDEGNDSEKRAPLRRSRGA